MPRATQDPNPHRARFEYGALTPSGRPFQCRSSTRTLCFGRSYNPTPAVAKMVWAAPLSLATTHGMLSFPPGTEMFQFPEFPARQLLDSLPADVAFPTPGFPIRRSTDHRSSATPRRFSQRYTSFFGP